MSQQSNNGTAREETYVTSVLTNNYTYTWVIKNFSVWHQNGSQIVSSRFPSGKDQTTQWVLELTPTSETDKTSCSFYVKLISPKKEHWKQGKFDAECQITFQDTNGRVITKGTLKYDDEWDYGWGWKSFLECKTLLAEVMPENILHIKCNITWNASFVNETLKGNTSEVPEPLPSCLARDLNCLIDGDQFGDVALLVDDQQFLAYKGILAARSSVFAAMFNHEMQESIENSVTINDIDPDVFKELLRYIYTDQVSSLETMAHKLYTAADMYDIPTLKSLCRNHILKKLNLATGAETLMLADAHGDQEMKQHTLQFLSGASVAGKVTSTAGWKKMLRTHPYLVEEAFIALAQRKTASKK